MDSYSRMQTEWTLDALRDSALDRSSHVCDIGGGHGHLLCHLLARYPRLRGSVLERPSVLENRDALWADRLDVGDRCEYIGGDMFADVPVADAYILKMVLHNWSDRECIDMLGNVRQRALPAGRLFVVEHVVPGPRTPHFAKLFDLHMMTWGTGRERSEEEYADLLTRSGWSYVATRYPSRGDIGVVEGAIAG
jgi:hypothetical protein